MYYFVHGEYFVVDIDKDNIASSVHIGCHPKIEKSCLQVFNIWPRVLLDKIIRKSLFSFKRFGNKAFISVLFHYNDFTFQYIQLTLSQIFFFQYRSSPSDPEM